MRQTVFAVVALLVALQGAVGCTSVAGESQLKCDVTNLREVFANPLAHDGKLFCGQVYMLRSTTGAITFYVDKAQAESARYDLALVPDSRPSELLAANESRYVFVAGKLQIEEGCFTGKVTGKPNYTETCTPIRRPVYIAIYSAALDPPNSK